MHAAGRVRHPDVYVVDKYPGQNISGEATLRIAATYIQTYEHEQVVKGIDILNNTPLLDIKPFVPEFDIKGIKDTRIGWLSDRLRKEAGE